MFVDEVFQVFIQESWLQERRLLLFSCQSRSIILPECADLMVQTDFLGNLRSQSFKAVSWPEAKNSLECLAHAKQ